jgi:hypothetical protein
MGPGNDQPRHCFSYNDGREARSAEHNKNAGIDETSQANGEKSLSDRLIARS